MKKWQTIGQLRDHPSTGFGREILSRFFEDRSEPQTADAQESFIASILPIELPSASVTNATVTQMRDPPDGEKDHQEPSMQVLALVEAAVFDLPASTLAILKGGFHLHPLAIGGDPSMGSWQIGDQDPRFLVFCCPTDAQVRGELVLLPEEDLSIPGLPRLRDAVLALLPISIHMTPFFAEPLPLFDAQHIMPSHLLAEPNEGQTAEPTICQQRTARVFEQITQAAKERTQQIPLALLPGLFLRHLTPGEG